MLKNSCKSSIEFEEDDDSCGSSNSSLSSFHPTIYLHGDIDKSSIDEFIENLEEVRLGRKSRFVVIDINSPGGEVLEMFRALNAMKASGLEIYTYCSAEANSAAAVILSAGSYGNRYAAPLSMIMVHKVSGGVIGDMDSMSNKIKYVESMNRMLINELSNNCGKASKFILDKIKTTGSTDLFMEPKDALKLGLIDHIGYISMKPSIELTIME